MATDRNSGRALQGVTIKLGATSMRTGRPEFVIPVNLNPTAMSASKELFADIPTAEQSAFPASPVQSAETAELIGQGILPLRDGEHRGVLRGDAASRALFPKAHQEGSPATIGRHLSQSPAEQPELGTLDDRRQDSSDVAVMVRSVPSRQGRPKKHEPFPFDTIAAATAAKDGVRRLAAARQRHKGKKFISRQVGRGLMIWRTA
jgi:hypothetical protein